MTTSQTFLLSRLISDNVAHITTIRQQKLISTASLWFIIDNVLKNKKYRLYGLIQRRVQGLTFTVLRPGPKRRIFRWVIEQVALTDIQDADLLLRHDAQ